MEYKITRGEGEEVGPETVNWKELEEKSSVYIERFHNKQNCCITFNVNRWLLACFLSDIHIGNLGTDYKQAHEDACLIAACPDAFAVGVGDYIDNFIRASILDGLINQTTSPKQQLYLLKEYINFFEGKLIIAISGNHDRWSKEVSGLDFLAPLAKENKIQYSPDVFYFDVIVNGIPYKIAARHKYRFNSVFNLTHSVKRMWEKGPGPFDIGVIGHLHEAALETTYIHGDTVVCIRTGSYKVADTYARKEGYSPAKACMPCVALCPSEKKMVPFMDLKEGIAFVEAKNGK